MKWYIWTLIVIGVLGLSVLVSFGLGWLLSLALAAAFNIHAPVWALAIIVFVLGAVFNGSGK